MDTISFCYTRWEYGADPYPLPAVKIFLNGVDFMEEIHAAERIVCGEECGHAPLTPEELYDSLTEDYKEDSALIYALQSVTQSMRRLRWRERRSSGEISHRAAAIRRTRFRSGHSSLIVRRTLLRRSGCGSG